jgi:putative ABC transport system permease protein
VRAEALVKALSFAARALVRQPGRATLGVAGIAAVGALLFDMLLLSNGLIVSFRHVLDELGYDVRVTATDALPGVGPRIPHVSRTLRTIRALPEVADAAPVRLAAAEVVTDRAPVEFGLIGSDPSMARTPWLLLDGRDVTAAAARGDRPPLIVNRRFADELRAFPGDTVRVRGTCGAERSALPPVEFRISGIARFPFDDQTSLTAAATFADVERTCGEESSDSADLLLITSQPSTGPDAAVAAIRRADGSLHAFTNEQLVGRIQEAGLSYFRQISTVLASVTLTFGFLLIAVLLTVGVNQRLGEIATLRALGFSRRRIAADVLCQSALLVGVGGALALPLGVALSTWLDAILRAMPGIPGTLHFFEYEPRALVLHVALLALTAIAAAAYPVRIVARLPIAATLRNEVVS